MPPLTFGTGVLCVVSCTKTPGGERARPGERELLRDRRDQPFFAFAASSAASAAASSSLRSATLFSGVRRRGLFGKRGLALSSNRMGLSTPKTLCAPRPRGCGSCARAARCPCCAESSPSACCGRRPGCSGAPRPRAPAPRSPPARSPTTAASHGEPRAVHGIRRRKHAAENGAYVIQAMSLTHLRNSARVQATGWQEGHRGNPAPHPRRLHNRTSMPSSRTGPELGVRYPTKSEGGGRDKEFA